MCLEGCPETMLIRGGWEKHDFGRSEELKGVPEGVPGQLGGAGGSSGARCPYEDSGPGKLNI